MKRKLLIFVIAIMLLFPVIFAFRSQSIVYWLTGSDYRIKEAAHLLGEPAVANSDGLISLEFIQEDLSRLPFILNLDGHHLYGGRNFSVSFFEGGAIITDNLGRTGVMNNAGEKIIPFEYDRITYSDESFMATRAGQPTIYFDKNGQPLFQTSQAVQTPFSGGLVYLSNGVHNKAGSLIFNPEGQILTGFHDGLASVTTGSQVIIYQADGTVRARFDQPKIFGLIEGFAIVGDDQKRQVVDFDNQVYLNLTVDSEGLFQVTTAEGKALGSVSYDDIQLVGDNQVALRHRLVYHYYDLAGNSILDPAIGLAELFQDGYSLSSRAGQVKIYQRDGRLVKTIDGNYVPDSFSEGTFVVVRPDLNGNDSHYLYHVTGQQLTYRPLTQIMAKHLGLSVVFDAEKGIGYIRDELASQWVFVPSKLIQGARYSLPIGLGFILVGWLFIRRYKL